MERRNWMELSRTLIQKYKICTLYSTLKNLPLQIFITAVSSFSGPIALLVDKGINHQFILPQTFINNIVILNCKGQIKKTVPYNAKDKIIFLGFTKIQQLLIIEASGDYWLIDPYSGQLAQGNYTLITTPSEKQERYRGCQLMPNNRLVMIRQKQFGYCQTPTSKWKPFNEAKIKVQNPIFTIVFNSTDQFIFLSKNNCIEKLNVATNEKVELYKDSFLNDNWQKLLAISYLKEEHKLGLVFCNPPLIFCIDLNTYGHKRLDAMIQLKYGLQSSSTPGLTYKYTSRSAYKPTHYTLSWMIGQQSVINDVQQVKNSILIFANPKLLVMYDGQATRLSPRSNCNQMISVQSDCIRVYTEDSHEIYRIVPYLYQTVIEINKINEGYYIDKFRKIIHLHDEYTNYLEKDIIDLTKLDNLWKMGNRSNQINSSQNYPKSSDNKVGESSDQVNEEEDEKKQYFINKENTPQVKEKIQKIQDEVIRPLIKAVRYCIDPVDQVKMLKFICFVKNLYNSSIDIYELCQEMRIVNNLKFEFLNRTLTVNQFEYLKYEAKDRFLTILLRYNMHFIADTIFGDSDSKYRIFLHWAKCKIEKNSDAIAFEQIKQKFETTNKKLKSTKVFTDIAKYCLDRGKEVLAESLIELDTNPDRKIMMYLLMLAANKDKRVVEKLLNAAQESTRSFLIFRVVRELIETQWLKNHAWVNILYEKPNVARHYIRYLKSHAPQQQDLLKNYYLQNKDYQNLGLYYLQRILEPSKQTQTIIPRYSESALSLFFQKIEDLKKFLPNLTSVAKSYTKNVEMDLLRKVKQNEYVPTEQDLKQIKNDIILEYIGEILLQKQKTDTAISAICKIKSDKVYNILLRKERFRDALQLAFSRKNKQAIMEINERVAPQIQAQIEQRLKNFNKK